MCPLLALLSSHPILFSLPDSLTSAIDLLVHQSTRKHIILGSRLNSFSVKTTTINRESPQIIPILKMYLPWRSSSTSFSFCYFLLAPVSSGSDGQLEDSYIQKLDLGLSAKGKYPLALVKLMTRYGEDLIWANKITKAEAVLNFIVTLTEGRSDASEMRKGKLFLPDF